MAYDAGAVVGHLRMDMSGWTQNVAKAQSDSTSLKATMKSLGDSVRMASLAFGAIGAAITLPLKKMIMLAGEDQRIFARLQRAVENVGVSWSSAAKRVDEFTMAIERQSVYSHDEAAASLTRLIIMTGDLESAMGGVKLAADFASSGLVDFQTASKYVGMAMSGQISKLGRMLPDMSVANDEILKTMTGVQLAVYGIDLLQKKFRGLSEAELQTLPGQLKQLHNYLDLVQESIGETMIPTVTDFVKRMGDAATGLTRFIKANSEAVGKVTLVASGVGVASLAIAAMGATLTLVVPGIVMGFHAIAIAAGVAWAAILGPIGLIVAGLAGVAVAAYVLRAEFKQNLYGMKAEFQGLVNFIGKGLENMVGNFGGFFHVVGKGFINLFNSIVGGWMGINAVINSSIRNMFDPSGLNKALDAGLAAVRKDYFGPLFNFITDEFKAEWMNLKEIGAATAAQMIADIAVIRGKFPGQSVGEQMQSWFPVIPEPKPAPGASDVEKGAADAAKKALEDLIDAGKAAYYAINPVEGIFAKLQEDLLGIKAAGLLTDDTRSLLGVALWDQIKELAPASIQAIIDKIAALDPAIAAATESVRQLAIAGEATKILTEAQPDLMAFQKITGELETLKTAGRMGDETMNIMSAQYWREWGGMADAELQRLIDRLDEMGGAAAEVGEQLRTNMALESVEKKADPELAKINRKIKAWEDLRGMVGSLAGELSTLGSNMGSTALQAIGQIISALLTMIITYYMMMAAAIAAGTAAAMAWMAILGPIYLVVAAINLVISLFMMCGSTAKKEITTIQKLMKGLQDVMNSAIDSFADAWVDFLETGKFEFKEFVDSVLKDLARMMARLAMQEIIGGVFGLSASVFSAKGNVFKAGNIVPFARGGVVPYPTMFPMPANKRGMMGEAGPEAVFPLTRTRGGDLGVRGQVAPVNIVVNDMRRGGEPVQVSEQTARDGTRQLQITIRDAIESIAAEGGLKRTLRLAGIQGAY